MVNQWLDYSHGWAWKHTTLKSRYKGIWARLIPVSGARSLYLKDVLICLKRRNFILSYDIQRNWKENSVALLSKWAFIPKRYRFNYMLSFSYKSGFCILSIPMLRPGYFRPIKTL